MQRILRAVSYTHLHDSADKRLASQVDTYPLNQGQISVFTEELLKLSLEQPRLSLIHI